MYSFSCLNILIKILLNSLSGNSNKSFPLGASTVKLGIFKEDILRFFMLVLFLCRELPLYIHISFILSVVTFTMLRRGISYNKVEVSFPSVGLVFRARGSLCN